MEKPNRKLPLKEYVQMVRLEEWLRREYNLKRDKAEKEVNEKERELGG